MNKFVFVFSVCLVVAVSAVDYRRPVVFKRPVDSHIDMTKPIVDVLRPTIELPKPHLPTEEELEQNKNARYEFATDIQDNIHDLSNYRSEVRDGLKVVGQYSYSDGFFRRTTYYEADENGYRVTKTEEEPLEGPVEHLSGGEAAVSSHAHGADYAYKIKSVPHDDEYVIEEVL